MWTKLKGYKTYVIVVLMFVYVLLGWYFNKGFDGELLLEALALAGIRNAIPVKK